MTPNEKRLYHQIHPAKLSVDISTSLITAYFAWEHNIFWFLVLFLVPSVIVSWLLVSYADLEPLKNSSFGQYLAANMTPRFEVARAVGQLIVWFAAWVRMPFFIVAGFLIIIVAWLKGLIFRK